MSRLEEKYDALSKLVNDICNYGCEGFLPSKENTPTGGDKLYQNSPNPFDKETRIEYYLNTASEHSFIAVYNSNGVMLQQFSNLAAGRNFITINAGALTTGTYFYSLHSNGSRIDTKTMTIIK